MRRYPKEFKNLELSASDIEQIKGLGDILAEIEALTILFQGSSYTSMQFVLPLIFNLDIFLNEIIEDTHEELTVKDTQLKEACKLGLLKLRKYFNRSDFSIDEIEPWAIAIILDPRLRFNGFPKWGFTSDTITLLKTRFQKIFNRYELEYRDLNPKSSLTDDEIQEGTQQKRTTILNKAFKNVYGGSALPDNEIETYLRPGNEVSEDVSYN